MTITSLVPVGFWKANGHAALLAPQSGSPIVKLIAFVVEAGLESRFPSVFDHIDESWDRAERELVARYVSDRRHITVGYMGSSTCRICGKSNGSADFSDDRYIWPEGFGHYIRDHAVRPPEEFIRHVRRRV